MAYNKKDSIIEIEYPGLEYKVEYDHYIIRYELTKLCVKILNNCIKEGFNTIKIIALAEGGLYFQDMLIKTLNSLNNNLRLNDARIKNILSDSIKISSYDSNLQNNNEIQMNDSTQKLFKHEDEYLIVVDDMLDSGKTMSYIDNLLCSINNINSKVDDILYIFLFSNNNTNRVFNPEYIKYNILIENTDEYEPDKWYFGCGLDLNQKLRNLNNLYSTNKDHFLNLTK